MENYIKGINYMFLEIISTYFYLHMKRFIKNIIISNLETEM